MRKVVDRFGNPDSEVVLYVDKTRLFSAFGPICRLQVCDIVTFQVRAAGTFAAISGLEQVVGLLAGETGHFV